MGISCQKIERLLGINLGIHLDPFFWPCCWSSESYHYFASNKGQTVMALNRYKRDDKSCGLGYIYIYLNHFHELFSPITTVEGHSWSICPDSSRCQGDIEHEKNHIDVADLDVLICRWLYPKMFYAPTHGGFTVENKMGNGCMCTKK